MNKKPITLSLLVLFALGATACVSNEDPIPTPPQSKIRIENSYRILRTYPDDEIPSTGIVDLEDVTEVADNVFASSKHLKELVGKSLQKVGASALSKLTLGTTIPQVADDAFAETSEEKALIVPEEVHTAYLAFAHKFAFKTINGEALPQIVVTSGEVTNYPDYLLTANLSLPETITSIGANVFADKTIVTEVHATKVTKIGAAAFKGATSLAKLELGETVPVAEADAFAGTPQDKNLIVPESAVASYKAFATEHGFKMINGVDVYPIPYGVTIEGTELKKVSSDTPGETLELPPYVTTIAFGALQNVRNNIKHIIGAGVTEIAENAFRSMTRLQTASFPKLRKIGRNAFNGAQALKSITAPLVEEVGVGAFRGASALTEVNFPLLREVPADAFRAGWDGKLARVILPNATVFGDNAFGYHPHIQTIELGATPPTGASGTTFDSALKNANPKVIVPASALEAYGGAGAKWLNIFTVEAKQ